MRRPRILEVLDDGTEVERITSRVFRHVVSPGEMPRSLDGVAFVSSDIEARHEWGGDVVRTTLADDLPERGFVPNPALAIRHEFTFEDAIGIAAQRDRPVLINRVREGRFYWFFPIHEIGSCGYVVSKLDGLVTDLGELAVDRSAPCRRGIFVQVVASDSLIRAAWTQARSHPSCFGSL